MKSFEHEDHPNLWGSKPQTSVSWKCKTSGQTIRRNDCITSNQDPATEGAWQFSFLSGGLWGSPYSNAHPSVPSATSFCFPGKRLQAAFCHTEDLIPTAHRLAGRFHHQACLRHKESNPLQRLAVASSSTCSRRVAKGESCSMARRRWKNTVCCSSESVCVCVHFGMETYQQVSFSTGRHTGLKGQ